MLDIKEKYYEGQFELFPIKDSVISLTDRRFLSNVAKKPLDRAAKKKMSGPMGRAEVFHPRGKTNSLAPTELMESWNKWRATVFLC